MKSGDVMWVKGARCPCGKSYIVLMWYYWDDPYRCDWGLVVNACPKCGKKYVLEYAEPRLCFPGCQQDNTILNIKYCLTPRDYPAYHGKTKEEYNAYLQKKIRRQIPIIWTESLDLSNNPRDLHLAGVGGLRENLLALNEDFE